MASELLNEVPDVEIDESGDFKYIVVQISDQEKNSKLIVKGNIRGNYHADILDELKDQISSLKIKSQCLGGGRITHKPQDKYIKLYSYSQGFGKADHQTAANILKNKYPDYNITWSDNDCDY